MKIAEKTVDASTITEPAKLRFLIREVVTQVGGIQNFDSVKIYIPLDEEIVDLVNSWAWNGVIGRFDENEVIVSHKAEPGKIKVVANYVGTD